MNIKNKMVLVSFKLILIENTIISNHTSFGPDYFIRKFFIMPAFNSMRCSVPFFVTWSKFLVNLNFYGKKLYFYKIKWDVDSAVSVICWIFLVNWMGFSVYVNNNSVCFFLVTRFLSRRDRFLKWMVFSKNCH